MNKDSSDFMITEYERISTEYLGLQNQLNDWFKAYLTIVGFPLTVLAAALKIGTADISASLNNLPDLVAAVLILISLLGLFVTISIIAMRMEMILYIRTINAIRRFFGEKDKKLVKFFIQPTSDKVPPFFEAGSHVFWQVILMGLLDCIIMSLGVNNIFRTDWRMGVPIGIIYFSVHLFVYYIFASIKEREWITKDINYMNIPQIAVETDKAYILSVFDKRKLSSGSKR